MASTIESMLCLNNHDFNQIGEENHKSILLHISDTQFTQYKNDHDSCFHTIFSNHNISTGNNSNINHQNKDELFHILCNNVQPSIQSDVKSLPPSILDNIHSDVQMHENHENEMDIVYHNMNHISDGETDNSDNSTDDSNTMVHDIDEESDNEDDNDKISRDVNMTTDHDHIRQNRHINHHIRILTCNNQNGENSISNIDSIEYNEYSDTE